MPVKVAAGATSATVEFDALGEEKEMSCQLCYRTAQGKTVYGLPFSEGSCTVDLTADRPANNVLFAVVCNHNYKYTSSLRRRRFGYRLRLGSGTNGTASVYGSWYRWQ